MGEGRAFRNEPDVALVLEQRENRGGGVNVCASPRRKPDRVAGLTSTRAAATAVCAPSRIGGSSPTGTGHRSYRLTPYDCLDFSLPMTKLAAQKAAFVNTNGSELPGWMYRV